MASEKKIKIADLIFDDKNFNKYNGHNKAVIAFKDCLICKKSFEYRVNWNRQKIVCSKECGIEFNKQRLAKLTIEQRKKGIKTRSNSIRWKEYVASRTGANHPNFKGGKRARKEDYQLKKWRKDVFMRDNYTCQHCKKKAGKLEAHHIKTWAEFPNLRYELENGITLCYDCHNTVHGKIKRQKTYKCVDCGIEKKNGRRKRCFSCAGKKRIIDYPNTNPKLLCVKN
jgi:5-methylcytosine-specific restriction endonuclease McrA